MLSKPMLNNLLNYAVIAGLLGIVSFGVFYLTRDNFKTETVPSSVLSVDNSEEDAGDLAIKIISLIPKDAIPAILDPEFTSDESVLDKMDDSDQVIGVFINGDARAYPIKTLSRHEIVNDVVGGESIAVTW